MERKIKVFKVARYRVGQMMLAFLTTGIIARFITNFREGIVATNVSNMLLGISFILFSLNLMITIRIQSIQLNSKQSYSSKYREARRNNRVA